MKRIPLIALAALPLTVGLVFAQQGAATPGATQRVQPAQPGQTVRPGQTAQPSQTTQSGQTPQTGQRNMPPQGAPPTAPSGTDYGALYLKTLAAQLGTTPEKLKAAAVKAGTLTIDAGVKAGDLPADRAADMKQRLAQNPFEFAGHGPGGPGGRGPGGHGHDGPNDRGPQGTGNTNDQSSTDTTTTG